LTDPVPRICLLVESFFPVVGGMERQARALAAGLAARGLPTLVVTRRSRPELAPREELEGYEVHRLAPGAGRWKAIGPVLLHLDELRDRYDLIYVSGFRALGIPAVLVGRARHKRVVLKADNNGELSGAFFDPALARLGLSHSSLPLLPFGVSRKALLRRADHFVAIAENLKREFIGEGVPPGCVTVIPNGVDLTRFRPAQAEGKARLRERLGLPPYAQIVLFSGRMVAWKGPLVLLEAWRQVVARQAESEVALRGLRGLLLFLGSGGADLQNCEAEALRFRDESGLERSVRFLGDVEDVGDYLRAADIFALPTAGDAFPLALVEAMACGLPVVTTLVGGLADVVIPEVEGVIPEPCAEPNALVVPPGDAAALRDALLRLLDDAGLRGRLGAAGAGTAQRFSQESVVERHVELFHELLAPRRQNGPA
jgi:glycosyltransferase involved in cell wall biosynthesis